MEKIQESKLNKFFGITFIIAAALSVLLVAVDLILYLMKSEISIISWIAGGCLVIAFISLAIYKISYGINHKRNTKLEQSNGQSKTK